MTEKNVESNVKGVAKTLNDFFSNVKNFEIPEYQCEDNIHNR